MGWDHDEFHTQLEPHRRAITLHCYRMLGSLQDAEEVTQESLLRAWQKLDRRRSTHSTRAWLYKIATNACLDLLKARRRRTLPHMESSATAVEHLWVEPAPDSLLDIPDDAASRPEARASLKESIGLAFITALQLLSPRQRAGLLLVDVLEWTPQETAKLLETSVASVNSLLQRARRNIELREESVVKSSPVDDELLKRYIATWESGDLDAFTNLLAEDALLSMPPQLEWYVGRDAIRRFLEHIMMTQPHRYRLVPLAANGSRAVAVYTAPISGGDYKAAAINVLSARGGRISEMVRFAMPHLFRSFGLPDSIGHKTPVS
jgi:RNA polymerase sigma-70 factor (ECF subfamily)